MPTRRQSRTFHSRPPGVGACCEWEELLVGGVPTRTWNAGLASDGMSREKVVRRVLSVNEEWDSACARRRCRALEVGDIVDGRDS